MALTLGDNFSYQGAKPLDARLTYATIAEMAAKADSTLYDGILAYCKADEKNYQWKSTNPVDPTTGKWREFTTGGGGASDLVDLEDVNIEDPADGEVLKYDATEEKWVNGEVAGGSGRAKSTAIAPEFDDTATYAAGERVMYKDELYVFNKPHTGAWAAADADKTDVDGEIPAPLTSAQMQEIKDAFVIDAPRNGYPVLFDETGAEHFVAWHKLANGTKKPIYQKTIVNTIPATSDDGTYATKSVDIANNVDLVCSFNGFIVDAITNDIIFLPFFATNSGHQVKLSISTDRRAILANGFVRFSNSNCYLTFKYTKTTDAPQ